MDNHVAGNRERNRDYRRIWRKTVNHISRMSGGQPVHLEPLSRVGGKCLLKHVFLPGAAIVQYATRLQNGMLDETSRRVLIEVAPGTRQGTGMRRAIGFHVHGRRPARRVVAWLRLLLKNDNG